MKKFNWLIVGTGAIANEMANALLNVHGEIYGVYNHHIQKAKIFAEKYTITKVYETLQNALEDKNIDIVYIAVPHNLHYDMIIEAIKYGKHILCEKSITVNDIQLNHVVKLANEKSLVLSEAMTIYHMPIYKSIKKIINSGIIGKVKMIQVNFGSCKPYNTTNRFFSKDLAGGALLDIGTYAISFARYFLDEQPNSILTTVDYFETGVDEQSGIIMKNNKNQMAVIALTMRAKQPKCGVISGDLGYIEIEDYPRACQAVINYTHMGKKETIIDGETRKALEYEIYNIEYSIKNLENLCHLNLSIDVMNIMSNVRRQWGLIYPFEN